jgi:hypothetical protein
VITKIHDETAVILQQCENLVHASEQNLTAEMERQQKIISAKLERKDSHGWQFGLTLLPVIATAFLGWLVFHLQITTNAKIDRAGKELSTRLALSQQFYTQRFTIYDGADKAMVQLFAAVRNVDRNPGDAPKKQQAVMLLTQLNLLARTTSFYMTPEVSKGLGEVWIIAAQLPQLNASGTKKIEDLDAAIKGVEKRMRKELLVNVEALDE